jgi:hypothetical protein
MSLESEIARLVDVLEKGFSGLTARQSEIISLLGTRAPLAATASSPAASPDVAAKPADIEPAKRGRPKAEPAAPAPAASPPAPAAPAALNGEVKPSFDEVVAIAQELARRKTPPVAIKLINQHGAQKLADMDPANYPAFYAAAMVELAQPDAL